MTKQTIGGQEYALCDHVRDDLAALEGFLALSKAVFGLNFAPWRAGGWWGGDYIPHAIMESGRVVANVSANVIRSAWRGEAKRFIQLGTVMTDPAFRGRGLSRHLMEAVCARYDGQCDGMYLYANNSVLDFYPKFGFVPTEEHQCALPVTASREPVRKMDMDDPRDRALLTETYSARSNPCSALPMLGNTGLLMFYCGQFLKDCVYEIPGLDAVAVAEYDGDGLLLYDVFGGAPLQAVLSALAKAETRIARLGFTPLDAQCFQAEPRREEDTTLFVKGELKALFSENRAMFPLLSHA